MSTFPAYRPRRLRISENVRRMVRETVLTPADLIYPLFVVHGQRTKREISSMSGNYHWSVDMLAQEAEEIAHLEAEVMFLGHTHVPAIRQMGRTVLVNPGSLGQPRHGTPSPTYAVWEDGELQIRHIHFDPSPVLQKLSLLPLDPEHITRLQTIIRTALG